MTTIRRIKFINRVLTPAYMQLILSHVNAMQDLRIILTAPERDISIELKEKLEQVIFELDVHESSGKIVHIESAGLVNYFFYVPSILSRTRFDKLMLSAELEPHENAHAFEMIFQRTIQKLIQVPNLYMELYNSWEIQDPLRVALFNQISEIISECFFEIFSQMSRKIADLAVIGILGCPQVGKSSIVHRLVHAEFTPDCPPNCDPNLKNPYILASALENLDFQVFDICGHAELQKYMESPLFQPNALVYVVDCTIDEQAIQADVREFHFWMDLFFASFQKHIPKTTPVLILANKIDLNPDFDLNAIENLYQPEYYKIKFAIRAVSSVTGEGLEESFEWLFQNIKNPEL